LAAWDEQDAAGYADLFAEDGSIVGFDGSMVDGRQAIEDHLAGIFADHRTARFVPIVREVRPLSGDAYLLRAVVGMVPPGGDDLNPATNAIQSMVAVRKGNGWQIALFHTTPAQFHSRPEAAAALTEELQEDLRRTGTPG
jgi:uncharacterized protein (TIGR02246 family)